MNNQVDFVITWVDNNDPDWKKEKEKYANALGINTSNAKCDTNEIRYRDMDCLKYWFRAVEKYAPWVHKIFFVTYGHIPNWLNTDCPKLQIVNHRDFIPKKYLPTFNSNAIEALMHKIPNLSESFVYFNDDMFLTDYTKKEDFFKNGIPCDSCSLRAISIIKGNNDSFYKKVCNDIEIINSYFDFQKWKKDNFLKIVNPKIGKYLLFSIPCMIYNDFPGFNTYHLPISYSKSIFNEVWNKEEGILKTTMSYKFRNNTDSVNHWLFEYWQFAKGQFAQRSIGFGKSFTIDDKKLDKAIIKKKYKTICINDSIKLDNFEVRKKEIAAAFEKVLPNKSSFESN